MKIRKVDFVKSVVLGDQFFDSRIPHMAFYGRSNMGKSSTINTLMCRKGLAKSSSKPGKTTEINFFFVNDAFYVVDLPGYGYAKLSKGKRIGLRRLIDWYVDIPLPARIHVLLLDAKVGITDYDRQLVDTLVERKEKLIMLINKVDKVNQKELSLVVRETLAEVDGRAVVIPFSAHKKKGVEKFWQEVEVLWSGEDGEEENAQ